MADHEKRTTDEEIAVAFSGNAHAANEFTVTTGPMGVRIAFLERAPNGSLKFCSAVSMHTSDGIRLQRQLAEMLGSDQSDPDQADTREDEEPRYHDFDHP